MHVKIKLVSIFLFTWFLLTGFVLIANAGDVEDGDSYVQPSDCKSGKYDEYAKICGSPEEFDADAAAVREKTVSDKKSVEAAIDGVAKFPKGDMPLISSTDDPGEKLRTMVGKVIQYFLGIIGSISLIVFVYSGIMWMTAGGNDQTLSKAQKSMVWAALGLFAVFISFTMIKYFIKEFSF